MNKRLHFFSKNIFLSIALFGSISIFTSSCIVTTVPVTTQQQSPPPQQVMAPISFQTFYEELETYGQWVNT